MKARKFNGANAQGGGPIQQGVRGILKSMVTAACVASLAFIGCSDGKKTPKVVTDPNDKPVDPGKVVSALDSLVSKNKGTGKGVVTGFLTGEGKSVAKGLLKQARNAAGERRLLTYSEIPLSGATVLIFNAEKPTTLADTTLKTDTSGTYTAVLPEGKYFGFAVYLDLETFQLVTTQIPNMNPIKDSIIKMDTAVAIEDVTAPTVVGVYDAASANSDGVFLVGSVPDANAKINISFSEPMNRESAKGVVLGKVDTSSSSLALADTLAGVTFTWSGDSKELTLNAAELSAGVQYGIIIPVSLKDLAKNPLEAAYKATFAPVAVKDIEAVAFAVANNFPEADGTLKPIQNPIVSFNRPVDVFSVVKGAKINPAMIGFWEVVGGRATFIHKAPFVVGTTYTVSLPDSVKDLGGNKLGAAFSYKFKVVDFEGAAKEATGANQAIALSVEAMFDAYTAGDLGRFSAAFHTNFRMYQGAKVLSKTQFLDNMKADFGQALALRNGIPAPVFDIDSATCKDQGARWKVGAQGDASTYLWVESYINAGSTPRVWDKDKKEIDRAKLAWDRTGPRFTYEGKVYGFAPDFSAFGGGISMDGSKDDIRFMADVMAKTSTIILEPVKMEMKETFLVDGGMSVAGDTARLAVKMTNYEKLSRASFDFHRGCSGQLEHTRYEILKFQLVNDGSRWMVLAIVAPDEEIRAEDFNKTVDMNTNFVASAKPLTLVSPVNGQSNVAAADGSVKLEFNGVVHDSVGGYLVGLAEDPKFTGGRPPYGALLFVKASNKTGAKESFTLDASGKVAAGDASVLLRRAQDLRLPGWERTMFEYTISKLYDQAGGFAGVFQWKVIAVKDTSAAQFLSNGFLMARYFGESDFGPNRGHFAVKGFPNGDFMARLDTARFVQPPINGGSVGFGDMDQDGIPDFMEQKYGSDMRDRNSYPDFRVDTDGDKLCDYLEKKLDPTGADSLVDQAGDAATIKEEIAALAKLVPPIVFEDSDGDGFPDDVEQMLGFNPRDALNNPGSKVRANVPVGVFAGKVQVGATTHSLSFKLSQDSAKALWVYFTAYFGKDTIVDTSRANFNDLMGEVQMALPLPKNGPDSGKALLLRGRYESFQALLMGPVDMIMAPAKTSINFGSGPYVGQFAASGRGEDVSRFLPGSNTGGYVPPVTTNPPMGTMGYRPPPTGTSEGAQIILDGLKAILVDDFGDTLAVIENVMWRGQPDGGFQLSGEQRVAFTNGLKRSQLEGRLFVSGDQWVFDGAFFQSIDSAGSHRDIPGQACAKAAKASVEMIASTPGVKGKLVGWIAQDKNGAGFQGPVVTNPTCPAGQVCNTDPTCPAGQICNPGPTPGGTFSIPFMQGVDRYTSFLKANGVEVGGTFYVSMNGNVLLGTYDSIGVTAAKAPWCNQVILTLKPVPLTDTATDAQKAEFEKQKAFLSNMGASLIIALEDQYRPGTPARMEKARDYQGIIRLNAYLAEGRPAPMDYGRTTMQCQTPGTPGGTPIGGQTLYNGTVDAVIGALAASQNSVLLFKDSGSVGEKYTVDPTTVKRDSMRNAYTANTTTQPPMTVVFIGMDGGSKLVLKDNVPVVGPFGPTGTVPGGNQGAYLFLQMEILSVKTALISGANKVFVVRDSAGRPIDMGQVTLDANSLKFDTAMKAIVGNELNKPDNKVAFLAEGDVKTPKVRDGLAVVLKVGPGGTGGNVPPDTTKPQAYKGTLSTLQAELTKSNWMATLIAPPPALPVVAEIDDGSLKTDGQLFMANEVGDPTKIYVFMGLGTDPTKVMLVDGKPAVTLKPVTAGP